jgi:hypothetical protein
MFPAENEGVTEVVDSVKADDGVADKAMSAAAASAPRDRLAKRRVLFIEIISIHPSLPAESDSARMNDA